MINQELQEPFEHGFSFSPDELGMVSAAVRDLFTRAGVTINRASRLALYLAHAESIATAWNGRTQIPASDVSQTRGLFALFYLSQAAKLFGDKLAGQRETLRKLAKEDLGAGPASHSRCLDHYGEIMDALSMATLGFEIEFREPDVVANVDGRPLLIASKRTVSNGGLRAQIRRARDQIRRQDTKGVFSINVTSQVTSWIPMPLPSDDAAQHLLRSAIKRYADANADTVNPALRDGRFIGGWLWGSLIYRLPGEPLPRCTRRATMFVAESGDAETDAWSQDVQRAMRARPGLP